MHKFVLMFIVCLIVAGTAASAQPAVSYKPGGGLSFDFPDQQARFRLLAYLQAKHDLHLTAENDATQTLFSIRRTRFDFILDYKDTYQFFVEIDGRGRRTELVLAQLDVWYADNHGVEIGKFITPFSPEDNRSSRGLSTIERYSALNSLFLLPTIDTQIGLMFMGRLLDDELKYWLSISNGNGKASDNLPEDNDAKDVQLRLDYRISDNVNITGSVNYAEEMPQPLRLVDHTFNAFNSVTVAGERLGYLAAAEYVNGPFLARGEWFQYHFDESSLDSLHQLERFWGGYGELGYFLYGNTTDGLQLITRYERTQYEDIIAGLNGPTALHSAILGGSLYLDGLLRIQLNAIYEKANRSVVAEGSRFEGRDDALQILTTFQIKL